MLNPVIQEQYKPTKVEANKNQEIENFHTLRYSYNILVKRIKTKRNNYEIIKQGKKKKRIE